MCISLVDQRAYDFHNSKIVIILPYKQPVILIESFISLYNLIPCFSSSSIFIQIFQNSLQGILLSINHMYKYPSFKIHILFLSEYLLPSSPCCCFFWSLWVLKFYIKNWKYFSAFPESWLTIASSAVIYILVNSSW